MKNLKNFLELTHSNDPKGVIITDKDGVVMFSNKKLKQILKLKTDITGENFCHDLSGLLFRHNELNPLSESDLKSFLARVLSGEPQNNDVRLVLPEMSPIFVEHCSYAFTYEEKSYIFMYVTDISEQKRLREAHSLAQRTEDHDVRGFLGAALGFAELLTNKEFENAEEAAKFGSYIQKTVGNALQVGENRSLISQIQTGRYLPVKSYCDFLSFLKKEIIFSMNAFTNRGFEIKINYPGEAHQLSHILLDTKAIKPLLINLVKNALEATEKSKQKTISLSAQIISEVLILKIHNPGAIPKKIREKFMSEGATFGKEEGTGLGAFSAKMLAEALNGSISWETSEEDGTTITVSIPVPSQ